MKKYAFIIDIAKCENCNNCFLSCKDEHCGNNWPGISLSQPLHGQRWINIRRRERGKFPFIDVAYLPQPCFHCDNAPCVRAAGNGAVYRREDGIVIIDPEKAKGREEIVSSCPFGAIWWNEEAQIPQKCTFCAHLLDQGWKKTRCVQACPTGALSSVFLEDEELERLIREEGLERYGGERQDARPRCFYKNLHRYTRAFIAGTVATGDKLRSDCVEGATVRLLKDGNLVAEQMSDAFGDFKFDGLEADGSVYNVEVLSSAGERHTVEIELKKSCFTGTVWV